MGMDDGSIGIPGPMVEDKVIFLIYMPLDEAGLAFLRSAIRAATFSIISSAEKSTFPTEQ